MITALAGHMSGTDRFFNDSSKMELTMLSLLIAAVLAAQPATATHPPVAKAPVHNSTIHSSTIHNSTIKQLDARNARDSGNAMGGQYEARVMGILIEEMGLLRKCEMTPKHSPFLMYLDIAADGAIKDVRFSPATPMAACIRRTIAGKKFAPYRGGFLVKLIISAV